MLAVGVGSEVGGWMDDGLGKGGERRREDFGRMGGEWRVALGRRV